MDKQYYILYMETKTTAIIDSCWWWLMLLLLRIYAQELEQRTAPIYVLEVCMGNVNDAVRMK